MLHRKPSLAFCDDLRGVGGEGRDAREGGDIHIIMADLHCTAETIATLKGNFPQLKNKLYVYIYMKDLRLIKTLLL